MNYLRVDLRKDLQGMHTESYKAFLRDVKTYVNEETCSVHRLGHSSILAWEIPWTEEPAGL